MSKPIHQRIGEFIRENLEGCSFVGISDEGELFIAFDHAEQDKISRDTAEIKKEFPEVSQVLIVEKLDINSAKKMIDELNTLLEKENEESDPTLLNIEKF